MCLLCLSSPEEHSASQGKYVHLTCREAYCYRCIEKYKKVQRILYKKPNPECPTCDLDKRPTEEEKMEGVSHGD